MDEMVLSDHESPSVPGTDRIVSPNTHTERPSTSPLYPPSLPLIAGFHRTTPRSVARTAVAGLAAPAVPVDRRPASRQLAATMAQAVRVALDPLGRLVGPASLTPGRAERSRRPSIREPGERAERTLASGSP